jgi:hypothetical protein
MAAGLRRQGGCRRDFHNPCSSAGCDRTRRRCARRPIGGADNAAPPRRPRRWQGPSRAHPRSSTIRNSGRRRPRLIKSSRTVRQASALRAGPWCAQGSCPRSTRRLPACAAGGSEGPTPPLGRRTVRLLQRRARDRNPRLAKGSGERSLTAAVRLQRRRLRGVVSMPGASTLGDSRLITPETTRPSAASSAPDVR